MPFMEVNEGSGLGYVNFSLDNGWVASDGNEGQMSLAIHSAPILIEIHKVTQGWLQLAPGIRNWQPFAGGQPHPKPNEEYRTGFQVMFYSKKHFGESDPFREMTTNQFASKQFIKDVFNQAEAVWIAQGKDPEIEPFAKSGMSALVLIDPNTTGVKVGGGRSVKISFTIQKLMQMPAQTDAPAQPALAQPVQQPVAQPAPVVQPVQQPLAQPAPQPVAAPPVSARPAATAPTPPPASNDVDFSNISADEI